MIWKWLFSLLGLISFFFILNSYGFARIADDVKNLGWWIFPLVASFIPVVSCYSLAWLIVTPGEKLSALPRFFRFTSISVGWNNLSPFVKVLGEPVRVLLLEKNIGRKRALASVVLYNLVHMFGTLIAFMSGAAALLIIYPVPPAFRAGFYTLLFVGATIFALLYAAPKLIRRRSGGRRKKTWIRKFSFWLLWSSAKVRLFSQLHPFRFWAAVLVEALARFVEGATFYVAFYALGDSITISQAAILDVGRALMDNLFFFIPYQVGSREAGILLLTDQVMQTGMKMAVTSALLYRLVEVLWMGIGYFLWIQSDNSQREEI